MDIPSGAHKRPGFLSKNPMGQVPVIEDDDMVIYDSTAILVYLALQYDAGGTWLPREPVKAAAVQRWLDLAAGPIALGPNRARLAMLFKLPVDHSHAKHVVEGLLDDLDRELLGKAFAVGGQPTIADLAACSYIAFALEGGILLDPYLQRPRVDRPHGDAAPLRADAAEPAGRCAADRRSAPAR